MALAALAAYERRRADPLIEVRLFRSVPFAGRTSPLSARSPPWQVSCS